MEGVAAFMPLKADEQEGVVSATGPFFILPAATGLAFETWETNESYRPASGKINPLGWHVQHPPTAKTLRVPYPLHSVIVERVGNHKPRGIQAPSGGYPQV
jgi:hypothetical protein